MKIETCPSCGVRYNVERLRDSTVFSCRRCGGRIQVGAQPLARRVFSPGLLLAGLVALGALLLYANPSFGEGVAAWPWDVVGGRETAPAAWSVRAVLLLWAVAGAWALLTGFGIAPSSRSVPTLALGAALAMACTGPDAATLAVEEPLVPVHVLAAMAALAAGLWLAVPAGRTPLSGVLAFAGGALIVWRFVLPGFEGGVPTLTEMVRDVERTLGATTDGNAGHDVWTRVVPEWALLLAGAAGVLAGLGARNRFITWTGTLLLLAVLLVPTLATLVERLGEVGSVEPAQEVLAEYGTRGLVGSGLALWLLGATAIADLARNRRTTA